MRIGEGVSIPSKDDVADPSKRTFLKAVLGLGGLTALSALAEPINRLAKNFTPISGGPGLPNSGTAYEQRRAAFEGALDRSDINELRRLIRGPEEEKNIVEKIRKSAERLGPTDISKFRWDTETLDFNRRFLTIIDKFCRSLIGDPSAELTWLMKGNTSDTCGRIPVFPHVPMGAESSFGNAVIPTEPYRTTSDPAYPYGIYVQYDNANPSPLTTYIHEYVHTFIGLHRTDALERTGYGAYAHGIVDDITRIIRSEGFGYFWRDDRGVRGTEAQRQVVAVDAQDATSPYTHPDAQLTPLLYAYKNGDTGIFRKIVGQIQ